MTDRQNNRFQFTRFINRQGITLASFALVTAVVLTLTQLTTKGRIERNEKKHHEMMLSEVLSGRWYNYQVTDKPVKLFDKHNDTIRDCFLVTQGDKPVAVIISAIAPDGYSGDIKMLVGVSREGDITGVRITAHSETPGLGDAIEIKKSEWVTAFNGTSLHTPAESKWTVRKHGGEFDQFTGATITPASVINEVRNTLIFFDAVKTQWFES